MLHFLIWQCHCGYVKTGIKYTVYSQMVQKEKLCILREEGREENQAKLAKCLKLVNLVRKQWDFIVLFLQLSVIWNYFKIKFKIHFLWSHYLYDLPFLCLMCWYWITGVKDLQGVGSCMGAKTGQHLCEGSVFNLICQNLPLSLTWHIVQSLLLTLYY